MEKLPPRQRLKVLQNFISSFEYNFTHEQYFNVRKDRPLGRIMDTAKKITRDALPIKCVEAVFLGLYLTCDMEDLDRIPVGFKSEVRLPPPPSQFPASPPPPLAAPPSPAAPASAG